jgi:hypothetical protein
MMAVAVMLVGVMGIVALERATFRANSDARTTATATFNASRWVGILNRSALRWTSTTSVSGVPFLDQVGTGWFIPPISVEDPYGMDWYGVPTNTKDDVRFCTLINLQWLTQNSSMRADVITFWAFQGSGTVASGGATFASVCTPADGVNAAAALNAGTPTATIVDSKLRMVRVSTVIRRVQP